MKVSFCLISLIGIILCSCVNNTENTEEVHVIDVSNPKQVSLRDVFSELEVVYMDASVNSYIKGARDSKICDDKYLIMDYHYDFFVFDRTGNFISSSKSVRGNGHGEVNISIGGTFNPYTHNIEILTPVNIMIYDLNFKFVGSVSLPKKQLSDKNNDISFIYDKIYDLSDHLHLLMPNNDYRGQHTNTYVVFDSKKQEIIKEISYSDDVILSSMFK